MCSHLPKSPNPHIFIFGCQKTTPGGFINVWGIFLLVLKWRWLQVLKLYDYWTANIFTRWWIKRGLFEFKQGWRVRLYNRQVYVRSKTSPSLGASRNVCLSLGSKCLLLIFWPLLQQIFPPLPCPQVVWALLEWRTVDRLGRLHDTEWQAPPGASFHEVPSPFFYNRKPKQLTLNPALK